LRNKSPKRKVAKMTVKIVSDVSDDVWDTFIDNSPYGSVFSQTSFLKALEVPHEKLFIELDEKVIASALIIEPNSPHFKGPYPYSQYQGIALPPIIGGIHKVVHKSLKTIMSTLPVLSEKFDNIGLCLHPSLQDLRGFQWFNYHTPERGQFDIRILYSGIINLEQYSSFDDYLMSIRSVRRQEYKKAKKQSLSMVESHDIESFIKLYKLTFERQSIELDVRALDTVRNIVNAAISNGIGRLVFCKDCEGSLHSAIVTLHDKRCTYYMFGATDPTFRSSGASTGLILDSIKYSFACNHLRFDMVGINSPQRGDFKTSFNSEPTPYHFVSLKKQNL